MLLTPAVASPPDQSRRVPALTDNPVGGGGERPDDKLAFILQPLFISSFVSFVAVFTAPRGPELCLLSGNM